MPSTASLLDSLMEGESVLPYGEERYAICKLNIIRFDFYPFVFINKNIWAK
jgi:hypothetical protein